VTERQTAATFTHKPTHLRDGHRNHARLAHRNDWRRPMGRWWARVQRNGWASLHTCRAMLDRAVTARLRSQRLPGAPTRGGRP
jgi:hypothetical protein